MKIVNIPSYLKQADVHQWMDRLEQSLGAIFGSHLLSNFIDELRRAYGGYTLEFSYDEPHFEEGEPISIDGAKADLLNMLSTRPDSAEDDEFIKDLIQRIEDAETVGQLRECASEIAERCASSRDDYPRIMEAIEDLLGRTVAVGQRNRLYILGCYFHSEKKIVLYVHAINPSGIAAPLPLFEEVFAHEAFHAYHYYACEYASRGLLFQELPNRKDYTAKVVTESLAAFFEFYYCGRNGISTDIDMDWRKNPVDVYPYSGAKYILSLGSGALAFFANVFHDSLRDVDRALRLLLEADMYAFYDVKNIKERIIKTVTKQVPVTAPSAPVTTLTNRKIEQLFKGMGKGWFILKYAEDHGLPSPIPLDYGDANSYASKMSHYVNSVSYHGELIRYLKRKKLAANVRADTVDYRGLQAVLNKL